MLIACEACHRQYDVSAHASGSKVACNCGQINLVPAADEPGRGGDLGTAHCSSCGAGVPAGANECGFCGGSIKLGDRGYGDVCPHCLHRMAKGANFCGSCGHAVAPEVVPHALTSWHCPRCSEPLHERDAVDGRVVECHACGGLWLDEHVFDALLQRRQPTVDLGRRPPPAAAADRRDGPQSTGKQALYLACPVCSDRMHRRNFANASGVILDWCKDHGWWFDADELERVLAFVASGGMEKVAERRREDLRREEARAESRRASRAATTVLPGGTALGLGRRRGSREPDLLGMLSDFLGRFL